MRLDDYENDHENKPQYRSDQMQIVSRILTCTERRKVVWCDTTQRYTHNVIILSLDVSIATFFAAHLPTPHRALLGKIQVPPGPLRDTVFLIWPLIKKKNKQFENRSSWRSCVGVFEGSLNSFAFSKPLTLRAICCSAAARSPETVYGHVYPNDTRAWTPFISNLSNAPCYYHPMLGRIQYHVSGWFLFNEQHWFAAISSPLITARMPGRTFTSASRLESRRGRAAFRQSEQMYKRYFDRMRYAL